MLLKINYSDGKKYKDLLESLKFYKCLKMGNRLELLQYGFGTKSYVQQIKLAGSSLAKLECVSSSPDDNEIIVFVAELPLYSC